MNSYYKAGLVGLIVGAIFFVVGIIIAIVLNIIPGIITCAMGAGICSLGYYYIKKAASMAQEQQKRQESKAAASRNSHHVYTDYVDALPETLEVGGVTYYLHYKYSQVGVACNTMAEYADASSAVSAGDFLELEQEPDNIHDPKAVAIIDDCGEICGYLYRGRIQDMANRWLNDGIPVQVIAECDGCHTITLGFYRI